MSKNILRVEKLQKTFNKGKVIALTEISFSLEKGKILSIIGESGSGKTTLARLISGLETANKGEIYMDEKLIFSDTIFTEPKDRKIGMLFQDYALFPHMTVFENIAYGITKKSNKKERVAEVLKLVNLLGFEKRYPHELSGGQQQRVALARALAPKPQLLILDEPFSNLDVILRNKLRQDILQILKQTQTTAILVTHDVKDAMVISDDVLVLRNGKIQQKGSTKYVSETPENEYVKLLFKSI